MSVECDLEATVFGSDACIGSATDGCSRRAALIAGNAYHSAGSVEYFKDTVFNCPTLAEAYKVAALDGLNKL
jgi:hypothetical protein